MTRLGAPRGVGRSPLTPSDIKQMPAVAAERRRRRGRQVGSRAAPYGGAPAGQTWRRVVVGGGGRRHMQDPHAPSCLSQLMTRLRGAVVRGAGKLKQTRRLPGRYMCGCMLPFEELDVCRRCRSAHQCRNERPPRIGAMK